MEFNNKDLYTILKDKIINATPANPKIKINRLVLRLQSGQRDQAGAAATTPDYASFIAGNNGNFYNPSGGDGSFIDLMGSLPDSINEIWILPYQDPNSGFDNGLITDGNEQYFQDLYKAAQFIQHWKTVVGNTNSTIGNKIKGIVFETEGTTMQNAGQVASFAALNTRLKSSGAIGQDFTEIASEGGLSWGLTGPPSISNTPDDYNAFARFFPQYYNIDSGVAGQIAVNSQAQTNSNFTTPFGQDYTLDSDYTRMFSVEPFDPTKGKWGNNKWGSNSNPSLSKMIEYITTQQNPQGGYMLYCDAAFWNNITTSSPILE